MFVVKSKERILPLYCCPFRLALKVKWWPLGQRLPPLFLWCQHCPGPLRHVWLSTASCLMDRSSVTQRTYPSTNTTMYFIFLFFSIGTLFSWTRLWLFVCWISSGISKLEQWQSPTRWAGIAHCDCPWTQVPGRNRGNGDAWWHSAHWPRLDSEAGMTTTLLICQSLKV